MVPQLRALGTLPEDQRDLPAPASWVLGLKACTTMPGCTICGGSGDGSNGVVVGVCTAHAEPPLSF